MDKVEISGWERSKISNQDQKSLKKLGLMKKKDSLIFPGDESFPSPPIGYRVTFIDHLIRGLSTPIHEFLRGLLFVYGIQLHQLTPNSILHISIFITLCECFLRTHPHWGLWKRIFYLRHNNSRNVIYNMGGVGICVRTDVDYFDVKFPDSVQGWHKRWLYIREEYVNAQEYGIAPFDGAAEILRRRSWDAEASAEEKTATNALMKRIHQLQNTHGEEPSGVQITAYFLRIRVQPRQARKNPLWMYAGEEDVDRVSRDLSVKDLEKLIRRFSSLSKKHEVPSSCRVEPYSGSHALPENHQILSSLPPLPEGGEVDERTVVNNESQESSHPESEVVGSHKSAAFSDKGTESEASESGRSDSPPLAVSPRNKRKRDEVEDSGSSKPTEPDAEEMSPEEEGTFNPYDDAGSVSSGEEEEEETAVHDTAPTSTSNTVVLSEARCVAEESSPPPQQNVETSTPIASPRASSLKRGGIGAGESHEIVTGSSSTPSLDDEEWVNISPCMKLRRIVFSTPSQSSSCKGIWRAPIFPMRGPRSRASSPISSPSRRNHKSAPSLSSTNLALAYRQDNLKIGVEETIALVANSQQEVDWAKDGNPEKMNKEKWKALVKDAKPHSKKILSFLSPKPAASANTAKTEVK
ncbi:hypothetical protein QYE76_050734 [Lolium multiflorum]|uniref:Transposase (putative) gypsy type domain-containing protein n=1 Tax=Lolium multiflorum TaxID=4521 RepID=A0AAD8WJW5_LOLMU|nr:hypothetical protein QYE76_050734 [Lolium multiflorum]